MVVLPREEQENIVKQLENEYSLLLAGDQVASKIEALRLEAKSFCKPKFFEEDLLHRIDVICYGSQAVFA